MVEFNKDFSKEYREDSGALVDVNVYAEDYLTSYLRAAKKDTTALKLTINGGLFPETPATLANNDVLALFKIAQYSTAGGFDAFAGLFKSAASTAAIKLKVTNPERFHGLVAARLDMAKALLAKHDEVMAARIKALHDGNHVPSGRCAEYQAQDARSAKDYVNFIEHHCYETWLHAANLIYGEKISANAKWDKDEAAKTKGTFDPQAPPVKEKRLQGIGAAVSYSNEPMLSEGAVIHVVGIMQMCRPWSFDGAENLLVQSFLENFGDFIKVWFCDFH